MYIDYKLEGKYVNLRSVTEDDADFILSVRNDPRISEYLPPLKVTVEQQRQWISKQRSDKDSYYFLLEAPNGEPIGTIGVYDIVEDHAECGRACCIGEPFSAVEASTMLTDFVFNTLKLSYTTIWVYEGNKPVIALNHSYGYEWIENGVDDKGEPFRVGYLSRERALECREKLLKKLRIKK